MNQENKKPAIKLNEVAKKIRFILDKFLVMTDEAKTILTLWIIHTYIFKEFMFTPYIAVISPEEQSGKSQVLEWCAKMVKKGSALEVGGITPSSFLRAIDQGEVSIFYDETDSDLLDKSAKAEVFVIFNNGFQPNKPMLKSVPGKKVGDWESKRFNTFSPKMWASNKLEVMPRTVNSRSIKLSMLRNTEEERQNRTKNIPIEIRKVEPTLKEIREALEQWSLETDCYKEKYWELEFPQELQAKMTDREISIYDPLLKIANELGEEYSQRLRDAVEYYSTANHTALNRNTRLLLDIHAILQKAPGYAGFSTDKKCHDGILIPTKDLIEHLCEEDYNENGWNNIYGKPITAKALANLLNTYGIYSTNRYRNTLGNGYLISDFIDTMKQYALDHVSMSKASPILQPFSVGTYRMKLGKDTQFYTHNYPDLNPNEFIDEQISNQEFPEINADLDDSEPFKPQYSAEGDDIQEHRY